MNEMIPSDILVLRVQII